MLKGLIKNIEKSFTLDEIQKLQQLLSAIKEKREAKIKISPTLENFYQEYVNYVKSTLSSGYLRSIKLSFKIMMDEFGRDKNLAEISAKDAEDFKIRRIKTAPKGYAVYLRTLRAAFNVAVDWGLIPSNPFSKIKFRKVQKIKPVYLTEEQFNKIISLTTSPDLRNLFIISFFTGIRLCEAVNLRWRNIDIKQKLLTIGDKEFTTKNARQRIIPLCSQVMDILGPISARTPDSYVFSKSNGFPFRKEYVSKKFKESFKKSRPG